MSETYNQIFTCNNCGWLGPTSELEYDVTETCFGEDKIEICPVCGSMEIRVIIKKT